MAEPLDVACPDCQAPAHTDCRTSNPRTRPVHAAREESARLRSVDHGTCDLCDQPMVRGVPNVTTTGTDLEAWHPDPTHAAACPPLPDPTTQWNAYAAATAGGRGPGRPGLEHFVPTGAVMAAPLPLCPECAAGKHPNCDGTAWDTSLDALVACGCPDQPCGPAVVHQHTARDSDDILRCAYCGGVYAHGDHSPRAHALHGIPDDRTMPTP